MVMYYLGPVPYVTVVVTPCGHYVKLINTQVSRVAGSRVAAGGKTCHKQVSDFV